MVNCNPETVSTDYDTSDRLYFEPLTYEDVMNVIEAEQPVGIVVALGGQTPLKLAGLLPRELVLGTSPESIDLAEDRERWNALCAQLEIPQPAGGTAATIEAALAVVERVGYPVLMRPSYVLGGRAMEIVYDDEGLRGRDGRACRLRQPGQGGWPVGRAPGARRPVPRGRHRGRRRRHPRRHRRGAHRRRDGARRGGRRALRATAPACCLHPTSSAETIEVIEDYTRRIAEALDVRGLINVQYAVKANQVFVIEANPRASRTVPFVAKATGVPLAKVASRVMIGSTLAELRAEGLLVPRVVGDHIAVKEAVLPFARFPEADAVLGPEMRSTGEVMGIDLTVGSGLRQEPARGRRSSAREGHGVPLAGRSGQGRRRARPRSVHRARLRDRRHQRHGRAPARRTGIEVATVVAKLGEPTGTDAVELIASGQVQLVVNSPRGRGPRADGAHIRTAAGANHVPLLTTAAAGLAAANGMADWARHPLRVRSLQEYHRGIHVDQLEEN